MTQTPPSEDVGLELPSIVTETTQQKQTTDSSFPVEGGNDNEGDIDYESDKAVDMDRRRQSRLRRRRRRRRYVSPTHPDPDHAF